VKAGTLRGDQVEIGGKIRNGELQKWSAGSSIFGVGRRNRRPIRAGLVFVTLIGFRRYVLDPDNRHGNLLEASGDNARKQHKIDHCQSEDD
jgi:hypothetical protein